MRNLSLSRPKTTFAFSSQLNIVGAALFKTRADLEVLENTPVPTLTADDVLLLEEEDGEESEDDGHDDECYICGDQGDLLMCEGCPRCAHMACVGLQSICDDEDWYCRSCVADTKKLGREKEGKTLQITHD